MGIFDILYSIIINPLVLLFDTIYSITLTHLRYVGWSLVILSLVVNTLILPLYNRADEIQAKENEKKKSLKKWEDHIKKHFKGDERFMILQFYYKQNGYKPYQTLKTALPLLLEIPFFIAAYQYISTLPVLAGYSFGPIKDLSVPDQIITIAGVGINVMPILMTVINIISSFVYNRSTSFRDKLQLYIIALVFLVLLYNSPSGLVLYWTCNNIYSLIKNLVYKYIIKDRFVNKKEEKPKNEKKTTMIFLGAALLTAVLVGSFIPIDLMKGSVDDFISFNIMINPALYILNSTCIAFGIFVVWGGVYYFLMKGKGRLIIAGIMMSIAICGLLNYAMIPFDYSMTPSLSIDGLKAPSLSTNLSCVAVLVGIIGLSIFLIRYKSKAVGMILFFSAITFAFINGVSLVKVYNTAQDKIEMVEKYDDFPEIHLSKKGKNVVVIMMDRMVGNYVPYIINEKKELVDSWDGFTFYPNTISYGSATNVGSPGLYGGYEYTPERINERKDKPLKQEQNEALSLMPVLFGENGYDVTVGNPTYANYEWIPDLSIYDKYPYIYKYNTGAKLNPEDMYYSYNDVMKRNLVCYGLYRIAPSFVQDKIYNKGYYNSLSVSPINGIGMIAITSPVNSMGISEQFYNAYNVLCNMQNITVIDDDNNHFNMLSNDTTHEASMLLEPNYDLSSVVDNSAYREDDRIKEAEDGKELVLISHDDTDNEIDTSRVMSYHTNMATMLRLGEWFDYLRENGVYDNTKIIIVSDHSYPNLSGNNLVYKLDFEDSESMIYDMMSFQATLLVKDYNSSGFSIDDTFMTNADVPTIATDGLIDNPKNPFTGNEISSESKNDGDQNIICTSTWHTDENDGYTFRKSQWFSVHDNIFERENWKYIGAH